MKNIKEIKFYIVHNIIDALKKGDFHILSQELNKINITNIDPAYREAIEDNYYEALSNNLIKKRFEHFKELISYSDNLDIFIEVDRISHRFEIISELISSCIESVSSGYRTSALGEIIEIIRFYNESNLLNRDLSQKELGEIADLHKDSLLLSNLKDLFGNVNNSLLFFIYNELPRTLYNFFVTSPNAYSLYTDISQLIEYIRSSFFDNYSIYGLSVKKLGSVKTFFKEFITSYNKKYKNTKDKQDFVEFTTSHSYSIIYTSRLLREERVEKKHLVSPSNIFENLEEILHKAVYKFFSLSMVLLGGLGPQGHGFTYATPKGEVVEICSDIKENEAIIIKYKEFLKRKFLKEFDSQLENVGFKQTVINQIIDFLNESLLKEELINYRKKDELIARIKKYITENETLGHYSKNQVDLMISEISKAISLILRPINMVDQFKTRMELIKQGKINSEDIAKLTSLRNKSHYDVLRERFFYQHIVKWFYDLYVERKGS
ncbi:MAG: hypothetical protein EU547_06600 [Promethearchaeota archaeon]|nr:MAG: hypothetical protein EU547_06600 [Candidatus Lokiarchaeota archaeon]